MATVQKRSRQSRALDMLEAQLKSGVKTINEFIVQPLALVCIRN